MRLLYLNPTASMGGAERVLLDLLRVIRDAQPSWRLALIVAKDGPLAEHARALGVTTRVLPFPRDFARIGDSGLKGIGAWVRFAIHALLGSLALLGYIRRLRREVAALAPDVMHSNGFKMHLLSALVRPPSTSLVWHFHDYLSSRRVACFLIQRLKHRCNAVIAVSHSVAADISRQVGSAVDVHAVWNAVDLTRFTPGGPTLDLDALSGLTPAPRGTIRIGLVATFARWKGHRLFLEVMQTVLSRHNVRAYIVGGPLYETDGSQCTLEELRGQIRTLGIASSVGLTGFVEDSASALRSLDIVVHASTAPEPFGLVIAEAMAAGRAVVVSENGGVAEFVTADRDALTYPQGHKIELANRIERLVVDAELRRRLGDAAHQAALQHFTPERVCREVREIYALVRKLPAAA